MLGCWKRGTVVPGRPRRPPRVDRALTSGALDAHISLNIIADVAVFAVPLPALVQLNLPLQHKIAACTLISLGSLGCIASAVRFYELWWTITFSRDSTWDQGNNIWSTVELMAFITCASVTGLKPLFDRTLRPLLHKYLGSSGAVGGSCSGRTARGTAASSGGSRSPWVLPTALSRRSRREPGSLPLSGGDDDDHHATGTEEEEEQQQQQQHGGAGDRHDDDDEALRSRERQRQRHSWHGSRRGSLIPLKDLGRGFARTDLDIAAESAAEDDVAWKNSLRQLYPC